MKAASSADWPDVIVIGSGMGGMTTAPALSRLNPMRLPVHQMGSTPVQWWRELLVSTSHDRRGDYPDGLRPIDAEHL
jgi:cation diffusion facilitator CzcD-associated flavoprotein CzcO